MNESVYSTSPLEWRERTRDSRAVPPTVATRSDIDRRILRLRDAMSVELGLGRRPPVSNQRSEMMSRQSAVEDLIRSTKSASRVTRSRM